MRRLLIPDPAALCALAVGLPVALSLLSSFDLFFNIASGRWILQHGFPAADPFSITASGPWFPHQWGYAILAALSVQAMGGAGPAVLAGAILAAGILLLYKTIVWAFGRSGLIPVVLLLLALAAQAFTWQAQRGYQLGNFLFVVALMLVFRFTKRPDRMIWLFVPLCALWANLHGSWLAGPALLGSVTVGLFIDRRMPVHWCLTAVAVALLGFASAAASPAGFGNCIYPLRFLVGGQGSSILEWHPMDLSLGWEKTVLVLLIVFLVGLLRAGKRPFALLIPALGLSAAAIMAERFAPMAAAFLAVACAGLLAGAKPLFPETLQAGLRRLDGWLLSYGRAAGGAIWPLLLLAGIGCSAALSPVLLEDKMDPGHFPVSALKTLARQPPGRVLNRYRFGGAVSAVAGPDYKVFIDGRNDLFPERIHQDYRKLVLLEPGWRQVFDGYDPDYILWSEINRGEGLVRELKLEVDFRLVVEDRVGKLWVRRK